MRLAKLLSKAISIFSGLLIVAAACLITYAALTRYLFRTSSTWQNELSIYMLMASVWLGCGPAMLEEKHVSIKLLSRFGGEYGVWMAHIFSRLACIAVGSILLVKGYGVTQQAYEGNWHASTTWAPSMVVPYSMVPVGMALFVVAALIRLFYRKEVQK